MLHDYMHALCHVPCHTEHEACAMDISELKWHVSYRGRYEARFNEKVTVAETLNRKLDEDIDFVKKHVYVGMKGH